MLVPVEMFLPLHIGEHLTLHLETCALLHVNEDFSPTLARRIQDVETVATTQIGERESMVPNEG